MTDREIRRYLGAAGAAAVLAAVIGLQARSPAQTRQTPTPTTTFRGGVEVVDVDVSVLDKFRQPVRGLTAADFTVLEDGKPRPIVAFTPVDLAPRELPSSKWLNEIAPDAQTNDLQREGRLVVVLLDRAIALADVPAAGLIADAAVDQMRPADLAAIVYTEYGIPQNFTADRRRLLAAIHQPNLGLPEDDHGESASCFCGTCTLERISDIADAVRDVRQRRKILFVVSSNIAVTGRGGSCSASIGDARARALQAIGAANLTVYVIDPTGLVTLGGTASARVPNVRGGLLNLQRINNLKILPEHTGGRAVFNNEPARTVQEMFRESNSYYVLGFSPAHADGRFHDIRVKVAQRDVILQARRGYIAGAKTRSSAAVPKGVAAGLHNALAGLWPKSDLPLTVIATPFAMPGLRTGAVMVEIGIGPSTDGTAEPATTTADATAIERRISVLLGAFDRNGRSLGYTQGTTDAGRSDVAVADLLGRLELKPGRYEIRAAVEDTGRHETGSVYTYVEIPNFLNDFVSMSGIFLYAAPSTPTAVLNDALMPPLPGAPTLRREFTRADRVSAWFQIYQGIRRPAMPGFLIVDLHNENDVQVFHQETRTVVEDVQANRAITTSVDLPTDTLEPGQYLLSVEMRQGNLTARRDLRFSMR